MTRRTAPPIDCVTVDPDPMLITLLASPPCQHSGIDTTDRSTLQVRSTSGMNHRLTASASRTLRHPRPLESQQKQHVPMEKVLVIA